MSILLFFFFLAFSSHITQMTTTLSKMFLFWFSGACMEVRFGEIQLQTSSTVSFQYYYVLCILAHITLNQQCVYGCSALIILETFLLWVRFAWEIQLKSFGPRHAFQLFTDTTLCAYMYCKHRQRIDRLHLYYTPIDSAAI